MGIALVVRVLDAAVAGAFGDQGVFSMERFRNPVVQVTIAPFSIVSAVAPAAEEGSSSVALLVWRFGVEVFLSFSLSLSIVLLPI